MVTTCRYPRLFGNYVLIAPLAQGGMGQIHLAVSGKAELRKLCAIKQILSYLVDRESIRRFVDEAKVMVKLSHGNVVPVFESGEIGGQYYLAMEYIEGKNLRALWHRLAADGRRCPIDVALHIVKEICRGLDYVHNFGDLGLVHRDISPPNVLLSYSGEVKVADFGLAYSRLKVQKTAPGVLFGKLSYMAPEQAQREPVDARADIFSVGVLLWELVTGRRLFPREGMLREQLQRAFNPRFELPTKVDPSLPAALDLITSRALARHPGDRYPSAEMLRRDIAGLQAQIDPTTDASALQRLLREVFGDDIVDERRDRTELLDRMTPAIHQLRSEQTAQQLDPAAHDGATDWPAGIEVLGEKPLDSETSAESLEIGTVLGQRYRVDGVIGEGGMGVVYRATHLGIDKEVAVKILHPLYSWMPEVVSRFQHEAKAASRIGHPNIIEIFDSGTTDDGCLYFAMEQLLGEDLADVLANESVLTIQRTVAIGIQICRALHAAHEVGVIHRDLKPENIFLVTKEHLPDFVKVLDFGVAQSMRLATSNGDRLTSPGTAMGTPEYMAPEQAAGRDCDHRADIYAVGSMLYEMLTGEAPDMGKDTMDVFNRKAAGNHTPIRHKRPDVPEQLARIIHWAIAYRPEDRPQSMGHMAYELTKITEGRPSAVASVLGLSAARMHTGSHPAASASPAAAASQTAKDLPLLGALDQTIPPAVGGTGGPPSQLTTAVVPTLSRPKHQLRNVAIGVLLVAGGMTVGALTLRDATPLRPEPRPSARPAAAEGAPSASSERSHPSGTHSTTNDAHGASARPVAASQPTAAAQAAPVALRPGSTSDRPETPATTTSPPRPTSSTGRSDGPTTSQPVSATPIAEPNRRRRIAAAPALEAQDSGPLAVARQQLRSGDFDEARISFERARRNPKTRGAALLGLAHVAFQRGNWGKSEAYAKHALTKGAGKDATMLLGNIAFKRGRYSEAIVFYRDVLKANPGHLEAKRNLESARSHLGL
jgi:serine/threonine protein kinase